MASTPGGSDRGVGRVLVVVDEGDEGDKPKPKTVQVGDLKVPTTTSVDKNGAVGGKQAAPVTAPAAAIKQVEEAGEHGDLRGENPIGVTQEQLDEKRQVEEELAANDQLPIVTPDAAPQQRGCVTALVRNYSSRRGVRPRLFVIHYTVSPNRPGLSDVNAVTNLFNTAAFNASSHYIIDREGNCKYIVRESDKSWTQAAANPFAISVEIINSGREPNLIDGPGLKKLGVIISDATKRWEIPLRRGAVSGCTPSKSGIVTHQMLGACGGGHVDTSPYPITAVLKSAEVARRGAKPLISVSDRTACRKLNWWRNNGRPHGKPEANAVIRRERLENHRVRCLKSGPVRA